MKDCFGAEFVKICKFDIDDILFQVEDFMPKLKLWQMKSSVITGDNFKVLCKEVFDTKGNSQGYNVSVSVMEDILYNYNLFLNENSIYLDKSYVIDGDLINEHYTVLYDGESVIRFCAYERDEEVYEYSERDVCSNYCAPYESLFDVCDELKKSCKKKVRVK